MQKMRTTLVCTGACGWRKSLSSFTQGAKPVGHSAAVDVSACYGAQASLGAPLFGTAVMDITVEVGSAARLDFAMILVVAGTAWASRSCHAARV